MKSYYMPTKVVECENVVIKKIKTCLVNMAKKP